MIWQFPNEPYLNSDLFSTSCYLQFDNNRIGNICQAYRKALDLVILFVELYKRCRKRESNSHSISRTGF